MQLEVILSISIFRSLQFWRNLSFLLCSLWWVSFNLHFQESSILTYLEDSVVGLEVTFNLHFQESSILTKEMEEGKKCPECAFNLHFQESSILTWQQLGRRQGGTILSISIFRSLQFWLDVSLVDKMFAVVFQSPFSGVFNSDVMEMKDLKKVIKLSISIFRSLQFWRDGNERFEKSN